MTLLASALWRWFLEPTLSLYQLPLGASLGSHPAGMRPSLLLVSCLNCHLSFTPKLPGEDWAKMNLIMTRQETEAWRTSLACAG